MQSRIFGCFLRLTVLISLLSAASFHAHGQDSGLLPSLLNEHRSIMLLIDPDNGRILDANDSALSFYGLPKGELLRRSIQDFNILGQSEVAAELERALSEARRYFIFPHRIASGEIRTVEVYSSPVTLANGAAALLSILHDITGKPIAEESMLGYQARLESLVNERTQQLINSERQRRTVFQIALFVQFTLILLLLFILYRYQHLSAQLKTERRSLIKSQAYNRLLFNDSHIPLVIIDPKIMRFVDSNQALQTHFGVTTADNIFNTTPAQWSPRIQPDGQLSDIASQENIQDCLAKGFTEFDWQHQRADGTLWDARVRLLRFDHEDQPLIQCSVEDITDQLQQNQQLRQLSMVVEQSPDSIVITDARGQIEYVNDAFLRHSGYSRNEVIGQNPRFRQSGKTSRTTYDDMWCNLLQGDVWRGELINRNKDHSESIEYATIAPVRNDQGEVTHYLSIQHDISAQRQAEALVHQLSYFDSLTGLPNRNLLIEWLDQSSHYENRIPSKGAFLLLNIDRFKKFNEAHNQLMGDALLKAFSERLSNITTEHIALARTSGDEFAVVVTGAPGRTGQISHHALTLAECIQDRMHAPITVGEEAFVVSVSIGITTFANGASERPADILRRADVALHRAKSDGGNQVAFFEDAMGEEARRRFNIERALRHAIANNELALYLQPQVNSKQLVVGAEALARWQHPTRGLISPAEFIPIAEESDLINDLGEWAVKEACTLIKRLNESHRSIRIAVNISARHFHQSDFVDSIKRVLAETQASPAWLILEVTESLIIDRVDQVVAKMIELSRIGVHFALDDFGTGYSSLAYLKKLPIDELKIDRAFVQDAPTNPRDAALVETIMAVARHMKLTLVAEGIETQAQADFFNRRGEVIHQGYLFGKPRPAEDWLQEWEVKKKPRTKSEPEA